MKLKSLAFFLVLAVATWGQNSNQSAPPTDQPAEAKTKCACCEKMDMGSVTGHQACCHAKKSKAGDASAACCGKEGAACCGDAASCAKPATAKSSNVSCCSGKAQCGAKGKGPCGEGTQTAMNCCGNQCGMHPSEPLKN
jgi:hypothetical protein